MKYVLELAVFLRSQYQMVCKKLLAEGLNENHGALSKLTTKSIDTS